MKLALLFFSFSVTLCFAQNQFKGLLLDSQTKEPIEFVNVYNGKDYTISNEDGRYEFSTSRDSVVFYLIGYDKLKTTFEQLQDTILLTKSVFELNEVVVTNGKTLYQKVKDSIRKNYKLEPYKEKFLIRALAKKDNEIWRIQDLQGKLKRNTLFYLKNMEQTKKDYTIELTNMRKLGAVTDENNAYLKFPSFQQILNELVTMNIEESEFDIEESFFENGSKIKLTFKSRPEEKVKNISGYYVIDAKTYAIQTYHLKSVPKNNPFKKNKFLKYRTSFYDVTVYFKKSIEKDAYFISSAKSIYKVETTDEEKSFNLVYELTSILTTSDNFGDFKVKKNVSATRDLFKLKYPYNAEYWNSQNQLLLTEEMQEFIQKMGKENNEFKVRSNMD
ncbi:hypothetical protein [Maribacter sp. 2308TA10-17]|uniref:hypothetical protein n=1 Tax=Maribacter sp. 2308TA10-17 TaxID=3386276 RepID=UPI0039BD3C1F